jgi:hypothetical protein
MESLQARLQAGVCIPAHPLALDAGGRFDERAQRALTRYYAESSVDGVAVGVHTTQFDLHEDRGLLRTVWAGASETAAEEGWDAVLVAGLVGDVRQAVEEAELAAVLGYDAVLLCPWGMTERTERSLLERAAAVGEVLPTIGFYLQDSVGGMRLGRSYWTALLSQPSTVAVKAAPFDRYRTNDVARALAEHDRWNEVALLTGNDDAIVHDLVTPTRVTVGGQQREVRIRGGLLGQWAVGARAAARMRETAVAEADAGSVSLATLASANDLVEVNAAVFDVLGGFAGCVAGVNEVLRQQGLLQSATCLSTRERVSPGQSALISEAVARFPDLLDQQFVAENRDRWLA